MTEDTTKAPDSLETLEAGQAVSGTVSRLALYGAMVNIGLERDALLHISQLGKTDFRNIEEVLNPGDAVEAYVLKVDREQGRVALTTIKPPALPWEAIRNGEVYMGVVTRIEKFGAFIDIGAERPGMVHVSEMADGYIQAPSDVVSVGDHVEVRIIKLNRKKRQIDLSMKTPVEEVMQVMEPDEEVPTAMALALRRAMEGQEPPAPASSRPARSKSTGRDQDDIFSRTLRDHSS